MRYRSAEIERNEKRFGEDIVKEPVSFSVIICTYNRADLLRDAVKSLLTQQYPRRDYEVIVVDNNSTDSTPSVVEELKGAYPELNLRYVFEEKQGLSAARNTGAKAAVGEILAFIDDDSEADSGWLDNLCEIYSSCPDIASVGGKIIPDWIGEKPSWFNGNAENIGKLDRGDKIKEFVFPEHPFGGNLTIKRSILIDLGGFSQRLGRKSKGLLSNEEKEFYYRLSQRPEYRTLYAPDAIVHHKAFADKLTKRFVLRRFYWQGVSESVFEQITHPRSGRELLASGIKRGGSLFPLAWRLCIRRISRREPSLFNGLITLSQELGMCKVEISTAIKRLFSGGSI